MVYNLSSCDQEMKFGIIGNTSKPMIDKVIPDLFNWLVQRKIPFVVEQNLLTHLGLSSQGIQGSSLESLGNACDVVLSFGGDGTLLSTARAVGRYGVPILGINLGRLGFLAEVAINELYECIEDILNNRYHVVERMVLKTQIFGRTHDPFFFSLNDLVVDRGGHSRLIQLDIHIDEVYLSSYLCDGVIVATPTGSTAYSLSAQGPILTPDVKAIVINPICPHSLGARPMVISEESVIKIIPHIQDREVLLSADGQEGDRLSFNEYIIVKKADYKVKWIQHKGNTFFSILRTKLNWGIDKRMN